MKALQLFQFRNRARPVRNSCPTDQENTMMVRKNANNKTLANLTSQILKKVYKRVAA